jgi:hypothetical protein
LDKLVTLRRRAWGEDDSDLVLACQDRFYTGLLDPQLQAILNTSRMQNEWGSMSMEDFRRLVRKAEDVIRNSMDDAARARQRPLNPAYDGKGKGKDRKNGGRGVGYNGMNPPPAQPVSGRPVIDEETAAKLREITCYNCGNKGHMVRHCRLPKTDRHIHRSAQDIEHEKAVNAVVGSYDTWILETNSADAVCALEEIVCYNCGGRGHIAMHCPSPKKEKAVRQKTGEKQVRKEASEVNPADHSKN